MISEIQALLKENAFEIKPITKFDCEQVMAIFRTNPEYFLLTGGKEAEIEDFLVMIDEAPANFDLRNKYFVGVWENGNCLGVLDLLKGYPNRNCIWIGLIMIHGLLQRRQIGHTIVSAIFEAAKIMGYDAVQLGVVDNNEKALRFWEKLGFEKIRESRVKHTDKPDWNVIIMEKWVAAQKI